MGNFSSETSGFKTDKDSHKTDKNVFLNDQMLEMACVISERFAVLSDENIAELIELTLRDIAEMTNADRCFLHVGDNKTGTIVSAYEWHRKGFRDIAKNLVGLDLKPLSWLLSAFEERKEIKFNSIEEIPPQAENERLIWREFGIKSLLGIPLYSKKGPREFLGITSEKTVRAWGSEEEWVLRQAASVLTHVMGRVLAEERFENIVKNSSDIMVIIDPDGRQVYVSAAAERITGFPAAELRSKELSEIIHPDDMEKVGIAWKKAIESPETAFRVDYRHIHKTKGWVHLEAVGQSFIDDPAIGGVVSNVRDITKRIDMENALRESEEKYKILVEHSSDLIWSMNDVGVFTYAPPVIKERFGFKPSVMVGKSFSEFVHPDDLNIFQDFLKTVVETKMRHKSSEYRIINPDGTWHWHVTVGSPVLDNEGNFQSLVGITIDITDRKIMEEQQILKEENLKDFLDIASHELKHPVSAISGFAELLLKHYQELDATAREESLRALMSSTKRLNVIVEELLNTSRIERGKFSVLKKLTDVKSLAEETVSEIKMRFPEKRFRLSIGKEVGKWFLDEMKIKEVLVILLDNAAKHAFDTEVIEVEISRMMKNLFWQFLIEDREYRRRI